MNKAFVKDSEGEDDELEALVPALPAGTRYYITRTGFQVLKEELDRLVRVERPEVVSVVSWAA